MPTSLAGIAVLSFAGAVLSALLVAGSIRYAHGRSLIDEPGQRRSHSTPTPRGGGIGIVVAVLLCAFVPLFRESPILVGVAGICLAAVALVGWIDDHRPLSARLRFAVHMAAGVWVVIAAFMTRFLPLAGEGPLIGALATVAIAWSINLHNFMDGINGILGLQAAFVFAVLAAFALDARHFDVLLLAAVSLAATIGFLPFNLPRAKIFLGDVGSGALGFLIAVLLAAAAQRGTLSIHSALLLASGFVVDGTATLFSRAARDKAWWEPHREHLYQWLHRSGFSHVQVDAMFLGWNVIVVLPLVAIIESGASRYAYVITSAAYAAAFALWWFGKRASLRRVKSA